MNVSTLVVSQDGVVLYNRLDTVLLATLASLAVPLLVNFLTKRTASDGLKSVVNLVAVAVIAVLALWINPGDTPVTWQLCVNTALMSFIASFAAYKGIWKPTGVAGTVADKTANFGLNSPPTLETDQKGAEDFGQVDKEVGNG